MSEGSQQLIFELRPTAPYALSYFVPHSGVGEAFSALEAVAQTALDDASSFGFVLVFGRNGTGKTHLLRGLAGRLAESGYPESQVGVFECVDREQGERDAGFFVSEYERLKKQGGVLLVELPCAPSQLTENPHLLSRFKSAQTFELKTPTESEFRPVIQSLSERHNLRLSAQHIEYLLKHLPKDLLSFDDVLAKMNEFSLKNGRPARFPLIREMLREE